MQEDILVVRDITFVSLRSFSPQAAVTKMDYIDNNSLVPFSIKNSDNK